MYDKIIIRIERQAYGGYGIGFIDGKAVFIQRAATGDLCEAELSQTSGRYAAAKLIRVIEPSEDRIIPLCPNFSECGGCSYADISYPAELRYKEEILRYNLNSIGGFLPEQILEINIIESPSRYFYRSHASVKTNGSSAGFFARQSNRLIPFPDEGCFLLRKELSSALKEMKNFRQGGFRIATDFESSVISKPGSTVTDEVNGIFYARKIENFFQSNSLLRGIMLETVECFAADRFDKTGGFLDIGCGVGFFSLYLGKKGYGRGFAADIDPSSIECAKLNAEANSVKSIEFVVSSDGDIDIHRMKSGLVIIDPPRAGITKRGKKTITAIEPSALIYVSCNPATFARDAKDLVKNGFSLKQLTMIDMFPMTHHIEVISLFGNRRAD